MIGDILISTQLLIAHLFTTFLSAIITTFLEYTWREGSSNRMSMLSPSIYFDYLSGQTEPENMFIMFLGTIRTHHISPMTIAMITDWKCRDQVLGANKNVTKHVIDPPTVWVSPLIITVELVTLTWFCFSRNITWLCQWHFATLITERIKKSWHSDWPSNSHKNVMKHALVTPTVLSITSDYHNWVRNADMDLISVRFCSMRLTMTFCSTGMTVPWV